MYTYNQLYFQYKKIYSHYLKKTINILNDLHGKNYDKDYWEPIIGLYLRRFLLNFLLIKSKSKKNFFNRKIKYKKINFFRNYREYADNNDFNFNLNKSFYKIKNFKSSKSFKFEKLNLYTRINNFIKIAPLNILIRLNIVKIIFFETYFKKNQRFFFRLNSFFSLYYLPILNLESYKVDKKKIFLNRLSIIKTFKNDPLLKNIILSMPINYLENYKIIFTEVEKISLPKGIYVDGNEINYDFIKFIIAKLRVNKKKIIIGQHSLRSGIQDYDVYFDYLKSFCTNFLTWGWNNKLKIVKKFKSLRIFSSIKKFKKVNFNEDKKFNIIYILCGFSKIGECLYDNYLENINAENARINLLKKILIKKKEKVFLKPRTGSFLLNNKKKFYQKFNILKYKSRMYDVFGKFNVVIFERLSLGIVESIYLNQPTIFYYPKNLYSQKNKEYNKFLYLLKKSEIFFDDPNKVLKIIKDKKSIYKWWYKRSNIQNRKIALKKYANNFTYLDLKQFIKHYK